MRRLICDLFGHRWAVTCDEDMRFFYHRRLCDRCGEEGISYRRQRNYPAGRTVPETHIPRTVERPLGAIRPLRITGKLLSLDAIEYDTEPDEVLPSMRVERRVWW